MKVIFVSEFFPPDPVGGAEISAKELATTVGRKHDLVVFAPSHGAPSGFQQSDNFVVFRYPNRFRPAGSLVDQKSLFFLEMTKRLAAFVREYRPHILHAQNALSFPAVAEVGEKHNCVAIAHVRDHRFECFTSHVACPSHHDATLVEFAKCAEKRIHTLLYPYARLVTRWILRSIKKCGRAFVVSQYLRSELVRDVNIDARPLYDGVDIEKIRKIPPAKEIFGTHIDSDNIILYGGGLHRFKGIFELIEGFRQVARETRNVSLVILGGGPEKKAVQRVINSRNLQKVALLGQLPHERAIAMIKAARLVIVPSILPEAGSRLVMESLACGKPLVVSNRGALPEMIGNAGIAVPPSAYNIARAILSLVNDDRKLEHMGEIARGRLEMFSLARVSRIVLRSYQEWLYARPRFKTEPVTIAAKRFDLDLAT